MINELTPVTSPNQIFWIYFLLISGTREIVKFTCHAVDQFFQQIAQMQEGVTAGEPAAVQQLITS